METLMNENRDKGVTEKLLIGAVSEKIEISEDHIGKTSEEQALDCVDDELISIESSDLDMADETYEGSDEDDFDGLTDYTADETVQFDINAFEPKRTMSIRPPWFKSFPTDCDAKNWEIFMETLEAFDHDTIREGIDDFIVTIETLMPHLASCFTLVGKDGTVTEEDVSSRIIIWLEMCLSRDVNAFEELDKMHGIAFGIVKTVAESPNGGVIGQYLIEFGVMEQLLIVLEESESSVLRMGALHAIFQLISSPTLWRESNAHLCEIDSKDPQRSLYSRLVALSLGNRFLINKDFLSLVTLTLSWSRFVSSLTALETEAHDLFSVISNNTGSKIPTISSSEGWNNFFTDLNAVRDYITEFDDEKVCAGFDVYAVLQSSKILEICVRFIRMSCVIKIWPDVLRFIRYLLNDKYYGTLFIVYSADLMPFYTELKALADVENSCESSQLEECDFFDEGLCHVEEIIPSAKDLHVVITYRLYILHLLDEIRGCAESIRHDIDNEQRVTALLSLCEICNDINGIGKQEVVWLLAQKYVYYLMDVIEHAASCSAHRSSAALALSNHLLEVVLTSVDDPKFWVRQAKAFSRLLSKRCITPSTSRLYYYIAPFLDPVFQTIGSGGLDIVVCLYKKIVLSTERPVEERPTVTAYARLLETAVVHANYTTRLEIFHIMEHERIFDMLARWILDLVQNRHALWQMGEPISSEASERFLAFAFPILRIFAAYFKACGSLTGEMVKLGTLSEVLLDGLILLWSTTGGMNGQKLTKNCQKIRIAVLDVLNPSLLCEKSLTIIIRHLLARNCSRPHLFAAVLGILLNIAPCAPPLILAKAEESSWKDVVIRHRQRLNRFVNAFCACENKDEFAEVLLAPSPYISEMSKAFVDRMCRLDLRLAQELVEILLKYMLTSFESRHSSKCADNIVTPVGSVIGDDVSKENETIRPASTGMVRNIESFMHLCKVRQFRIVLYYFLSRYPSRHHFLSPILSQFENATLDSERQSRYQSAVLDLLSGLCFPSLWSEEFLTFEQDECISRNLGERYPIKEANSPDPFNTLNSQEKENGVVETAEMISDEIEMDDTAAGLELVEETDCETQPSSSLEAILLTLCRFVNNADQKISAVQYALEIMAKGTSDAVEADNAPFLNMVSGCVRRIGLRSLFERLNNSFNSPEIIPCLHASTALVDNLIRNQPTLLMEILHFSSSDRLLESIMSQINDKLLLDTKAKCVLETLDRYHQLLREYSVTDEVLREEADIPLLYGKSDAVAELYCDPLLTVVARTRESYERFRTAPSILIKRRCTNKTRMGSEVAKIVNTYKGREKVFLKLLKTHLGNLDTVPPHINKEEKLGGLEKEGSVKDRKT